MAIKASFGVVAALVVIALAGCGGGSSTDDKGSSGGGTDAEVQRLLEETFGPNEKASSGMLSGTIDIDVDGVRSFRKPIQLSMSGPFRQTAGGATEAILSLGLLLRDRAYGAEMILVDDDVLIGLGSTAYRIPESIATRLRRPLRNDPDNALGSLLDVFSIGPRRWVGSGRIVGDERVGGVDVIHGTGDINAASFFRDVARFTNVLTSLRVTEIVGLPRRITPAARAALTRSVKSATGHIYTGADDKVLRRAALKMTLEPSAADRRVLGGITRLTITANADVTEVGSAPDITPPKNRGSYAELQITLDALEEAAQRDIRAGK